MTERVVATRRVAQRRKSDQTPCYGHILWRRGWLRRVCARAKGREGAQGLRYQRSRPFDAWAKRGAAAPEGTEQTAKTLSPSGHGDGIEIHWALPAGSQTPSLSLAAQALRHHWAVPRQTWIRGVVAMARALGARTPDLEVDSITL